MRVVVSCEVGMLHITLSRGTAWAIFSKDVHNNMQCDIKGRLKVFESWTVKHKLISGQTMWPKVRSSSRLCAALGDSSYLWTVVNGKACLLKYSARVPVVTWLFGRADTPDWTHMDCIGLVGIYTSGSVIVKTSRTIKIKTLMG